MAGEVIAREPFQRNDFLDSASVRGLTARVGAARMRHIVGRCASHDGTRRSGSSREGQLLRGRIRTVASRTDSTHMGSVYSLSLYFAR